MKNFFLMCFTIIFVTLIIPLSLGGYYIKIISPEDNSEQGNPVRVYGTWEYWRGTPITTEMINQRNIEIDWGDGNIDTAININRTRLMNVFVKGTFDTEPIIGCDNTGEVTSNCNLGNFNHVYSECGEFIIKVTMYPLLFQDYSKSIKVYVCDGESGKEDKCIYTLSSQKDNCEIDEFAYYNYTATGIGIYAPGGEKENECKDYESKIPCRDIIKLPFFGIKEFLIALLMIFGIYAFLAKRKMY